MTRTNQVILAQRAALSILSGRSLPTINSDLKISGLLKGHYKTPHEVIEEQREKLAKQLPEGWTSQEFPPDLAKQWKVVLDATQDMPAIPDSLLLREADLPRPVLDKDGKETERSAANRQGVADLVVALGDLFVDKTIESD